jgi:hypothetical protein
MQILTKASGEVTVFLRNCASCVAPDVATFDNVTKFICHVYELLKVLHLLIF